MDMILRAFWRSGNVRNTRRWNRGRVLLTGATGFLGIHLLRDLLKLTKVLTLYGNLAYSKQTSLSPYELRNRTCYSGR